MLVKTNQLNFSFSTNAIEVFHQSKTSEPLTLHGTEMVRVP